MLDIQRCKYCFHHSLGETLWNSTETLHNFHTDEIDVIIMVELNALIYVVGNLVDASF